jgi:hypothetical protein
MSTAIRLPGALRGCPRSEHAPIAVAVQRRETTAADPQPTSASAPLPIHAGSCDPPDIAAADRSRHVDGNHRDHNQQPRTRRD